MYYFLGNPLGLTFKVFRKYFLSAKSISSVIENITFICIFSNFVWSRIFKTIFGSFLKILGIVVKMYFLGHIWIILRAFKSGP